MKNERYSRKSVALAVLMVFGIASVASADPVVKVSAQKAVLGPSGLSAYQAKSLFILGYAEEKENNEYKVSALKIGESTENADNLFIGGNENVLMAYAPKLNSIQTNVRALNIDVPKSKSLVATFGVDGANNYFIASEGTLSSSTAKNEDVNVINDDFFSSGKVDKLVCDGKVFEVVRGPTRTAKALYFVPYWSGEQGGSNNAKHVLNIKGDLSYFYGDIRIGATLNLDSKINKVDNGVLWINNGTVNVGGEYVHKLNEKDDDRQLADDDPGFEQTRIAVKSTQGSTTVFNKKTFISKSYDEKPDWYPTPLNINYSIDSSGDLKNEFAIKVENSMMKFKNNDNKIFGNVHSMWGDGSIESVKRSGFFKLSDFSFSSSGKGKVLIGDVHSENLAPMKIALTNQNGDGIIDSRLFDVSYSNSIGWTGLKSQLTNGRGDYVGVNLELNGNRWWAHQFSAFTSLTGGGLVDMTKHDAHEVFIQQVSGDKPTRFMVNLNAADRSKSTMVYVADLQSPLIFDIANVDTMGLENVMKKPLRFATVSRLTSEDLAKVSLVKELPVHAGPVGDVSFEVVGVKRRDDKQKAEEIPDGALLSEETLSKIFDNDQSDFSANSVNYYIAAKAPTKLNESGEELLSSHHSTYWGVLGLDRLDKRLGERLMSSNNNGVWARARTDHMNTGKSAGDFSSNMYQFQVGYDHRLRADHGEWLLGAGLDYRRTRAEFKHTANVNKLEGWGAALYATLLRDDGINLDLTADYHRLTNRFNVHADVDGKNHLDVWRFSAEAQKRFDLNDDFSVTPEVQLQYVVVPGSTLGLDNGVSMHQDRFDSTVGRLGVRLDKKLSSAHDASMYAKVDVFHEFSGKQKVRFKHPTLGADGLDAEIGNKGTWYDVGVGGSWNIDRDCILSADGEYRFGHGLRRSFGLNVGVRWNF